MLISNSYNLHITALMLNRKLFGIFVDKYGLVKSLLKAYCMQNWVCFYYGTCFNRVLMQSMIKLYLYTDVI